MKSKNLTEGKVIEVLSGPMFRVQLKGSEQVIRCHLAGKMKLYKISVIAGDHVLCYVSGDIGRIERRL